MKNYSYFDGHNDVLYRLYQKNKTDVHLDFLNGDNEGHIDFPRMQKGNMIGGFFAIYVPNIKEDIQLGSNDLYDKMKKNDYKLPLPNQINLDDALSTTLSTFQILKSIIRYSQDKIVLCKSSDDFLIEDKIRIIAHIEGAEAIDSNFYNLEQLFNLGLRSIGPLWSRPNIFGNGVPFAFPSSPDIGDGLTDLGKDLIRNCNKMNIMIDLSHLNEKGFWDVAKYSDKPLVATHSNVHKICPHARNLTDKQLEAIKESNGIVGVNFAPAFLRPDGQMIDDTDISIILKHIEYLIDKIGENNVAIGSDYDGAMMPDILNGVDKIQVLFTEMKKNGFSDNFIMKLSSQNWLNFLKNFF